MEPRRLTVMRTLMIVFALTVAACGGGDVIEAPASSDGLAMCQDVPVISADPSLYRDRPVYVGNEMPVEEVQAWAATQPGFETLWIDREHNGWITVAFSEGAAERQADIEELFGDDGVVAVSVDWTMSELSDLQAGLADRFEPGFVQGSGVSVTQGILQVGIGPLTEERIAIAERELVGEPVCIEGIDPSEIPEPGPQPEAGDGWRLLADEKTGQAYRTGIATDEADLRELWREAGISAPVPAVDFETEVVIWFGAVYGSSCPNLRLDDVVVDQGIVYPLIVNVDAPMDCTDDANPHAYVVAVERSALPADGFVIRLQADEPFPGVVDQQTVVDGDVTIPGARVTASRSELPEPGLPTITYGGVIEPGYPWLYRAYVHCGVEWLGEINGVQWRLDPPARPVDYLPEPWRAEMDDRNEELVLEIVLTEGDPPTLDATANGHTERYLPAGTDPPGCD